MFFLNHSRARSVRSVAPYYGGASSSRSVAPLLYEIIVTHQAEKFGLETVRPTVQSATFSMRGQLHYGHYLSHYVMDGRGRR